jgi:hypothetical protein
MPNAGTTAPSERSNNFERLVQKLSEIFAGLKRFKILY